jgi:hypothetical protein
MTVYQVTISNVSLKIAEVLCGLVLKMDCVVTMEKSLRYSTRTMV